MNIETLPYRKEVTTYIINDNKEFIIVFSAQPGKFCKTPAGGVEDGETEKQAIIREIKEELGIDIEIIARSEINYKWEHQKERIIERQLKFRGSTGVIFITRMKPEIQTVKIQEEEISGYKWIKKEEIDKYLSTEEQKDIARKIFDEFKEWF